MVSVLKTFSEIIVQDFPFFILRRALPGGDQGKKTTEEGSRPRSAFQVLEDPEALNKFADKTASNLLENIQSQLRKEREAMKQNPVDYFNPTNVKKRFIKYAKKEGKPLHVYLSSLFQLFLGLAIFAFVASIFYKLFALIFLGLYLLMFAVSFMILHAIGYFIYKIVSIWFPTDANIIGDALDKIRFDDNEIGDGQLGGTEPQNYKSQWNNAISALNTQYGRISKNTSTVYGFEGNKTYSLDLGDENVSHYNNLKGWRAVFMPTLQQMEFTDIVGKDGTTIENNVKVLDITTIVEEILSVKDRFSTFESLLNKLDSAKEGKIQQVGGAGSKTSNKEVQAVEASKTTIIEELRTMIREVNDSKQRIEDLLKLKTETPDELHFSKLASNEYWQYVLKFPPIRFIIGIIHVYGYLPYSAKYSVKKLINVGTKITEVEKPLEEGTKVKPRASSGIDLLYKENSEGTIDALLTIFTWLALLCTYMAKGYLALSVLLLLLAIINGGIAHVWKVAIETVLTQLPPILADMGISLWDFTIKGVIDLLFGGTKAKINRKNELEKLNNKFGSGNAKMNPNDVNDTEPQSSKNNIGSPGNPNPFASEHLHDLYRIDEPPKNGKYRFNKDKYEEIKNDLSKVDLTSKDADAQLDGIQRKINETKKMWFTHWIKYKTND